MIVDFQHHWTPRDLVPANPGDAPRLIFDKDGYPSSTAHPLLYDLDEHIAMMDGAGINVAVISSPAGMSADIDRSRYINDQGLKAERDYPGRFIGTAHVNPFDGQPALDELRRCREELGFPGVIITSDIHGRYLDDLQLEPFWTEAERLGMFVFIHPPMKMAFPEQYIGYDLGRCVGREFSLISATVRLIQSGVLDRHPDLTIQIAHLGGSIAGMMGRIRAYEDRAFLGVAGHPLEGRLGERPFDYYMRERLVFDVGGFCGDVMSVRIGLLEIPAARMVFATDYPQEMRGRGNVKKYVDDVRALGADGASILSGNVSLLLKDRTPERVA
jgi:predicted TIM-barrel fold metal-dependent hydrolase